MKLLHKIVILFVSVVTLMLVAPFFATFAPANFAMVAFMIFFFFVYPIYNLFIGYLMSNDPKRLFWMPIFEGAVFPLLFAIAIGNFAPELYVYSLIYLLVAYISLGVFLIIRVIKNWEERSSNNE